MKKNVRFPIVVSLVGTVFLASAVANNDLSPNELASAFKGELAENPVALNQVEMTETQGEWGFVVRIVTFFLGAALRAPLPAHAPALPDAGCQTPSGPCTVAPTY